eukprot:SAG31_NODE_1308_length_8879_cov_3.158884_3_plen_1252_part_00
MEVYIPIGVEPGDVFSVEYRNPEGLSWSNIDSTKEAAQPNQAPVGEHAKISNGDHDVSAAEQADRLIAKSGGDPHAVWSQVVAAIDPDALHQQNVELVQVRERLRADLIEARTNHSQLQWMSDRDTVSYAAREIAIRAAAAVSSVNTATTWDELKKTREALTFAQAEAAALNSENSRLRAEQSRIEVDKAEALTNMMYKKVPVTGSNTLRSHMKASKHDVERLEKDAATSEHRPVSSEVDGTVAELLKATQSRLQAAQQELASTNRDYDRSRREVKKLTDEVVTLRKTKSALMQDIEKKTEESNRRAVRVTALANELKAEQAIVAKLKTTATPQSGHGSVESRRQSRGKPALRSRSLPRSNRAADLRASNGALDTSASRVRLQHAGGKENHNSPRRPTIGKGNDRLALLSQLHGQQLSWRAAQAELQAEAAAAMERHSCTFKPVITSQREKDLVTASAVPDRCPESKGSRYFESAVAGSQSTPLNKVADADASHENTAQPEAEITPSLMEVTLEDDPLGLAWSLHPSGWPQLAHVKPNGSAQAAGLRQGMLLTAVSGPAISAPTETQILNVNGDEIWTDVKGLNLAEVLALVETAGRPLLLRFDLTMEGATSFAPRWRSRSLERSSSTKQPRSNVVSSIKGDAIESPLVASEQQMQRVSGGNDSAPNINASCFQRIESAPESPLARQISSTLSSAQPPANALETRSQADVLAAAAIGGLQRELEAARQSAMVEAMARISNNSSSEEAEGSASNKIVALHPSCWQSVRSDRSAPTRLRGDSRAINTVADATGKRLLAWEAQRQERLANARKEATEREIATLSFTPQIHPSPAAKLAAKAAGKKTSEVKGTEADYRESTTAVEAVHRTEESRKRYVEKRRTQLAQGPELPGPKIRPPTEGPESSQKQLKKGRPSAISENTEAVVTTSNDLISHAKALVENDAKMGFWNGVRLGALASSVTLEPAWTTSSRKRVAKEPGAATGTISHTPTVLQDLQCAIGATLAEVVVPASSLTTAKVKDRSDDTMLPSGLTSTIASPAHSARPNRHRPHTITSSPNTISAPTVEGFGSFGRAGSHVRASTRITVAVGQHGSSITTGKSNQRPMRTVSLEEFVQLEAEASKFAHMGGLNCTEDSVPEGCINSGFGNLDQQDCSSTEEFMTQKTTLATATATSADTVEDLDVEEGEIATKAADRKVTPTETNASWLVDQFLQEDKRIRQVEQVTGVSLHSRAAADAAAREWAASAVSPPAEKLFR